MFQIIASVFLFCIHFTEDVLQFVTSIGDKISDFRSSFPQHVVLPECWLSSKSTAGEKTFLFHSVWISSCMMFIYPALTRVNRGRSSFISKGLDGIDSCSPASWKDASGKSNHGKDSNGDQDDGEREHRPGEVLHSSIIGW